MNQLDAVLAAMAHAQGRAQRTASFRHRRLLEQPLALSLWQLGSEPFSAAAIGYGTAPGAFELVVAGDPRNRDLAFAAVLSFAEWFLPRFEAPNASRETVMQGKWARELSTSIPQVLVANRASVALIGRLGRRLAYLRTDGDRPAPPELVRLGQHFQFLARHAATPGQQLIVPVGELVASHWVTPQTEYERSSLAAVDAFIEPPAGGSGFDAAAAAELVPVGPTPSGDDDERLQPLVEDFNTARARRTERPIVEPLLASIHAHYRSLAGPAWEVMWRAMRRELAYPEAPSVSRRWDEDRAAYVRHMDWVAISGRVRTRQTTRQAILTMQRMEDAKARLLAEEALDDPIRMIPYLLDGKAVEGRVIGVDLDHTEVARVLSVRRPLVTLHSEAQRALPVGKELWWTEQPGGPSWRVHAVSPARPGGWLVTLKLQTSRTAGLPGVGTTATFSVLNTAYHRPAPVPRDAPWPLRPVTPQVSGPIEVDGVDAA